jgi:arylsulfatase A-like enzyme
MKRRDFLSGGVKILGAAGIGAAAIGCDTNESDSTTQGQTDGQNGGSDKPSQPNILLMIVDEFRLPPPGYGPAEGEIPQLKELLGFANTLSASNGLAELYPAFARLRENAVVLRTHYIAAAACAPSRTSFITGAYPEVHTVKQTDGMFKGVDEVNFLDAAGIPTLGDWFRAGGYSTHWFGKWHCSDAESGFTGCDDPNSPHLEPWGFADWEKSCPEPHGGPVNGPAGGLYRDPNFADATIDFLNLKSQQLNEDGSVPPWLAVSSLVNPHDIGYYPNFWYLPADSGAQPPKVPPLTPAPVPSPGDVSRPSLEDGAEVPLNPLSLPQQLFSNPSSLNEDLSSKPDCHLEYSFKIGYGINSGVPPVVSNFLARPYQLLPDADDWFQAHGRFYCYLTYLANLEMDRVLKALDNSGMKDNTIVIFISDHGNLAGAHGGMAQKWHVAYDEAIRTPMVISSPLVNTSSEQIREVKHPTSLIDLVPTCIGLAGLSVDELMPKLSGHKPVELVGADLTDLILGGSDVPNDPDGNPRPGVLFTNDDNITELPDPALAQSPPVHTDRFDTYTTLVNKAIIDGVPIRPGSVAQPNRVRCLVNQEWKLARYFDPGGVLSDQWEMYHLLTDPTEVTNLLNHRTGNLRAGLMIPGLSLAELENQRSTMMAQLAAQEARLLSPAPL